MANQTHRDGEEVVSVKIKKKTKRRLEVILAKLNQSRAEAGEKMLQSVGALIDHNYQD